MHIKNISSYPVMLLFALLFAALPSITYQSHYWVNGNIAWLMIAAERMIGGQSLSGYIYETNPPLSIVLYIPHILTSQLIGIEKTEIVYPLTLFYGLISTLIIYALIKPWRVLNSHQKAGLLFAYFSAITIATTLSISEREHYIVMALLPFALCQYNISNNIKTPPALLWAILIIGSAIILVKPHYGIVPTFFLLQRLCRDKKITAIFKADFWALTGMTLLYALLLATIFRDYTTDIFHDVVTLYFGHPDIATTMKTAELYLVIFLMMPAIEFFQKDLQKDQRHVLFLFYAGCLLCLIPYFVQMKGYYYHMIPAYVFFLCGLTLSLSFRITSIFKSLPVMQSLIPALALLSFLNVFSPLSTNVLTRAEIKELPIATYIQENCDKPCRFYGFHGDIEIFIPTALALDYEFSSRFSAYWFLPELIKGLKGSDKTKFLPLQKKYSALVTQDFQNYKPSLVLIRKDMHIVPDTTFDYVAFFNQDQTFETMFKQEYRLVETRSFDRGLYFKGTTLGGEQMMEFDVYKRVSPSRP